MATEITMPKMGFDMDAGTLQRWVKKEGDSVKQGEVIAEIETDKATVEVESFTSGVIQKLLVKEGEQVPVGTPIALVGAAGEAEAPAKAETPEKAEAPAKAETPEKAEAPADGREGAPEKEPARGDGGEQAPAPARAEEKRAEPSRERERAETPEPREEAADGRVKASPMARRIAEENDVDLAQLTGTGPGGRIVRDDVERYMAERERPAAKPAAPAPAPAREAPPAAAAQAAGERRELTRMRQAIANRMTQSKTTAPHFYVTSEIDMGEAMAFRKQINATVTEDADKVSVNDLVVRAAALALRKYPGINASYQGDSIQVHQDINVGLAVALEQGLVTAVVHNADKKTLGELARESKAVIERARSGKFRPDDLSGATFTVSNLGMFDVDSFVAIINPPEAAILAVGSAREVPVIENGEVKTAQRMKVTISADHRVTDGAEAARFLQEVKRLLQSPLWLVL